MDKVTKKASKPSTAKKAVSEKSYNTSASNNYKKDSSIVNGSSLEESQPVYHSSSNSEIPTRGLMSWLGIGAAHSLKSEFDIIKLGNRGITKAEIEALAKNLGITRKAIAEEIFDLSVKTLERKSPKSLMDKKTSSHALEIARVMDHALVVFEDQDKVRRWINKPNKALNNMPPIQLFDTLTGLNLVNDILGRIEEGVYS
jgi:putative toxin-antitoxin system antitoxin component (TIGR02293 family)